MENKTVTVIGAANMDICGRPGNAPVLRDSNIGAISLSPGGVGRNMAHDLSLLGLNVRLVAALGDDANGKALYESCVSLGIDMSLSRIVPGGSTSCYLYVTDEKGDMLVGVNDMDIVGMLTPEYLAGILPEINASDAVLIDANLFPGTVAWIGENVTAPLYADPVSLTKAERLKPVLSRLEAIKPNGLEAMGMTGEDSEEKAALSLAKAGVRRVFVTMGERGILAVSDGETVRLPCEKAPLLNATGCGDSAAAAIVLAGVLGLDLESSCRAAMRAAALTMQTDPAVNPALRRELIL